jgi:hypothetical protein
MHMPSTTGKRTPSRAGRVPHASGESSDGAGAGGACDATLADGARALGTDDESLLGALLGVLRAVSGGASRFAAEQAMSGAAKQTHRTYLRMRAAYSTRGPSGHAERRATSPCTRRSNAR